jgi:hypothetical protein
MNRETIEVGAAAVASKSTYAGAGATIVGALLSNEFALVTGIVAAVGGFVINWYYRRQANQRARRAAEEASQAALRAEQRAEREHALRVAHLSQSLGIDVDIEVQR